MAPNRGNRINMTRLLVVVVFMFNFVRIESLEGIMSETDQDRLRETGMVHFKYR